MPGPRLLARLTATSLVLVMLLSMCPAPAFAQPLVTIRHAGIDRFATAVEVSRTSHPAGADTVVLARADSYADALAGAPLAATLDAPVLLTHTDVLEHQVAVEIARLGATTAILLGALDEEVAAGASRAGARTITRLGAPGPDGDPWRSWAEIAREVAAVTGAEEALLVEGSNPDPQRGWPDALAASAWAARRRVPVLLTHGDRLPDATRMALADLTPDRLTVVGGTAAVSDAVADAAGEATGGRVDRVAGTSRFDTAVAVARQMLDADGYTSTIWVASGRSWPDALVAGPAVAGSGGVLLLADPTSLDNSPQVAEFIDAQRGVATGAHLVGGSAVLSVDVARAVETGGQDDQPSARPDPGSDPDPGAADRPPAQAPTNTAPPLSAARPWSDPATWGGRLPQAGEVVTIPADQAVLLDVQPPRLRGIQVDGTLTFADGDLTLELDWIAVTGWLAIGTEDAPLTRTVDIVLHPQPGDEVQGGGMGPIAVQGGLLDIHGQQPAQAWTRLAATAPVGTTQLVLQEAPRWRTGDQLVIASTSLDPDEAEERTVTGVDGATVTIDRPLDHTHWGQTDLLAGAQVPQHAEVANLTRNVRIRSSDAARAAEQGGHVMIFDGSVGRISGAEFAGLGQAGALARYPVHFHMMGNASGSYVRGASIHHSFNRCLTIHGSNYVEVRDTIGYQTKGHCFFFEDGVEVGNSLHCNLGLSTQPPAEDDRLLDSDAQPATFWISNPANHLVGNAAAGSAAHGFWYDLPEAPTGLSEGTAMDVRRLPFGTFRDNVAHSSATTGWKIGIGVFVEDYHPPTPAVLEGTVAYKNGGFGVWAEGVSVTGAVLAENNLGFLGLDAELRDSTVVGATTNAGDRPWRMSGVGFYHRRSAITDVTFVNFSEREEPWQHPRTALEFISHDNNDVSEVSGATFVNANPLAITQAPRDGEIDDRSAAIRDVDGSVSGAPALLTADVPLLHDGACTWRADLGAHACPPGHDRTWMLVREESGAPLGGATLTRDDGAVGTLDNADHEPDRAHGDLLIDRSYRLATGNPLGEVVELIMAGSTEGHLDLSIPWPHAEAHVYDGWGRWQDVPAVSALGLTADVSYLLDRSTGLLHIRHTLDDLDEKGSWQRLEICARAFCGTDGPG